MSHSSVTAASRRGTARYRQITTLHAIRPTCTPLLPVGASLSGAARQQAPATGCQGIIAAEQLPLLLCCCCHCSCPMYPVCPHTSRTPGCPLETAAPASLTVDCCCRQHRKGACQSHTKLLLLPALLCTTSWLPAYGSRTVLGQVSDMGSGCWDVV